MRRVAVHVPSIHSSHTNSVTDPHHSSGSSPLVKIPTAHLDPCCSSGSSPGSLPLIQILLKILAARSDPRRDPDYPPGSLVLFWILVQILPAHPDPRRDPRCSPGSLHRRPTHSCGHVRSGPEARFEAFRKPSRRCRRSELRQQRSFLDPARPQDFERR